MPSTETQQHHPRNHILVRGNWQGATHLHLLLIEIRTGRLIIKVAKTHFLILADVTQTQNMGQPKI